LVRIHGAMEGDHRGAGDDEETAGERMPLGA
jgi:hypothetical protein